VIAWYLHHAPLALQPVKSTSNKSTENVAQQRAENALVVVGYRDTRRPVPEVPGAQSQAGCPPQPPPTTGAQLVTWFSKHVDYMSTLCRRAREGTRVGGNVALRAAVDAHSAFGFTAGVSRRGGRYGALDATQPPTARILTVRGKKLFLL
jgi:hypothetical protein